MALAEHGLGRMLVEIATFTGVRLSTQCGQAPFLWVGSAKTGGMRAVRASVTFIIHHYPSSPGYCDFFKSLARCAVLRASIDIIV
jgi:hypothetical protein